MNAQTIGDKVRQARRLAGLTQEQLAIRAGMSQPTIARIEKGRGSWPTLKTLLAIAHALGKRLEIKITSD